MGASSSHRSGEYRRNFTDGNNSNSSGDEGPPCCFPRSRAIKHIQNRAIANRIKQLDDSCHMEKKILKQNKNVPIGRSSSFARNHHHQHNCDSLDECDIYYPRWKSHLEQTEITPGEFPQLPEAISAGSTPNWFPTSTILEPPPNVVSQRQQQFSTPQKTPSSSSVIDHSPKQVFYYLTVLDELDNDLAVSPEQRPTPYQLYMQQQRLASDRSFPHVVVWTTPSRSAAATSSCDVTPTTPAPPPPPPVPDRASKPKPKSASEGKAVRTYRRV